MALLHHHRRRLIPGGLASSWLSRQISSSSTESPQQAIQQYNNNERNNNNNNNNSGRELYNRLSMIGKTGESVSRKLNEYIMEGNAISKDSLVQCIREFRKFRKFNHALHIMEWMQMRKMNFSFADHAVYLDIIAKLKGIVPAEAYFDQLPQAAKNRSTYGTLLNCYCRELMTDKAIELFDKMDRLNFISNSLPFNNLMTLYLKLRQPEKALSLVDQMERKNIIPCYFTYILWMQCYAALNDIQGVERVWEDLSKSDVKDWALYTTLASIYVKAQLFDKAELILKTMQNELKPRQREAYHFLISLYAGTSNLGEVYQTWDSLKSILPGIMNTSYLVMLQAIAKLQDIEGLTKLYTEWENNCSSFDIRAANIVIHAYLGKNMTNEAEVVLDNATKRCKGPFHKSREMFMVYYLKKRQPHFALEYAENTVQVPQGDSSWIPRPETVAAFLEYFEREKDVDGAERFCKILKTLNCLNAGYYYLLLKTYEAAGKVAPDMRKRLAEDGIEIHQELEELLQLVSPE